MNMFDGKLDPQEKKQQIDRAVKQQALEKLAAFKRNRVDYREEDCSARTLRQVFYLMEQAGLKLPL